MNLPPYDAIPTEPFPAGHGEALAWSKRNVPYSPDSHELQTLHIYVPLDSNDLKLPVSASHEEHASSTTDRDGYWVIYIHSGAWRDPRITAASFEPTIKHMLSFEKDAHQTDLPIAGFASLNYSLSAHPSVPPNDSEDPISRNARHPQHVMDVISGIRWLQQRLGFGKRYILVGHSCGATLALQSGAMDHRQWTTSGHSQIEVPSKGTSESSDSWQQPCAIVGLNGLYDLPLLVYKPGPTHARLQDVYRELTEGAFGTHEDVWIRASPATAASTAWAASATAEKQRPLVVLAQSEEDSLVPLNQTDKMQTVLRDMGWRVERRPIKGDHNVIWEGGRELAELLRWTVLQLVDAKEPK